MGSMLSTSLPRSISLEVEARDSDSGDGFTSIEIYGYGGELLGAHACGGEETCRAEFGFDIQSRAYLVARAVQADGDWLVAAPIWVDPEEEESGNGNP
jgi:hypothetical protein